jgi:formate hydrogenlyase transcriptional activator
VRIPPLRERVSDIPLLVKHFLTQLQRKLAKPLQGVTEDSMQRLKAYPWPGNIRELQNVLERACVMATSPIVDIDDDALPVAISWRREPVRAVA